MQGDMAMSRHIQPLTEHLTTLRERMLARFNLEELRTLVFDLRINYDDLRGEIISTKIQALLEYLEKQDRIPELLVLLKQHRPNENWDNIFPAEPEAKSPYKGLQFFDEADEPLFFGREQLTTELVDHLHQHRFLAVVGASGSGKSSVVRAGVVPAVRSGAIVADGHSSVDWLIHVITPGDEPLKAMAASLTRDCESVTATKTLLADLQADTDSLDLFLYRQMEVDNGRLLLIIDQFEELFTQCRDVAARELFVGNLVTAVTSGQQGRLRLVLTLRADFYSHAVQFESLRPLLETQQRIIGAMTSDELCQAVEGPASRGNWVFQPGLVDTILQDVGREPGSLPLLSHALQETWVRREGRMLTLASYQAAGGVRRAIAHTADAVYTNLTPEQQVIARNIFLRLTELGEGTEDTRRRAALAELLPEGERETIVNEVLDLLARRRLITLNEEIRQPHAEVAHEALIREWPMLREWLDENREGLRIQRDVTETAQAWQANGEDASYLYRGGRLIQAQEWAGQPEAQLNVLEQQFLSASQTAIEQEANEREAQRQRELEAAQLLAEVETRRAKTTRQAFIGVTIFLVLAVVAAIFGFVQRNTALEQATNARSQALASASLSIQEKDPMRGLLLAIAAGQTADTILAFDALNTSLPRMARPLFTLIPSESNQATLNLKWNRNESRILTISNGRNKGEVGIWDATEGSLLFTLPHAEHVNLADWNRDESQILTVDGEGKAKVWDSVSGNVLFALPDSVLSAAWNSSGTQILTASAGGNANVWDAKSGHLLFTLAHANAIQEAKWNRNGSQIITTVNDGTVKVWDAISKVEMFTLKHDGAISDPAWNITENLILTKSKGNIIIWDATNGERLFAIPVPHGGFFNAEWNKKGNRIITSDIPYLEGTANLWDASSGELLNSFQHNAGIDPQLNPDESQIMTGGGDGNVQIWDVQSGELILSLPHNDNVYDGQWNKDGSQILTNSEDGIVKVWDAVDGRVLYTFEHEGPAWEAKWNEEESQIIVASGGGITIHPSRVQIWEIYPNALLTIQETTPIREARWNKDGSQFLLRTADSAVKIFDGDTGELLFTLRHDDDIFDAWWNASEDQILTCSADGTAKIWDSKDGKLLLTLAHDGPVNIAKWNEQGNLILTHTPDYYNFRGTLKVWDAHNGSLLLTMSGYQAYDAEWNSAGDQILVSQRDRGVRIWNTQNGEVLLALPHDHSVYESTWNNDETKVLTSGGVCYAIFNDSTSCHSTEAKVWDAVSGALLLTLPHERPVWDAIWNSDETKILTSSSDGTAKVWDAETGQLLLTMTHDSSVNNAKWNRDESQILTWSTDGKAKVWDAETGALLFTFNGDDEWVVSADWNRDETRILLATGGGLARIYYTQIDELLAHACMYTSRNLTWSEWVLYFPGQSYRVICDQWPVHPTVPQEQP